jgi:hypothetical protein
MVAGGVWAMTGAASPAAAASIASPRRFDMTDPS